MTNTTNIQYSFVNGNEETAPMKKMQLGDDSLYFTEVGGGTFSTIQNPRAEKEVNYSLRDSLNWSDKVYTIGDFAIFPYGETNNLPDIIRDVIANNYIAPGLLTKKRNLLWGNGPFLYAEEIEENSIIRVPKRNNDIEAWLKTIDYENYLMRVLKDYNHIEACTTKYEAGKGFYIGENFISKIAHIPVNKVRKAAINGSENHIEGIATHVIVNNRNSNYFNSHLSKVYELYDPTNPVLPKNCVVYSNEYSFGVDLYTLPDIFGSLEWLRRSTATPLILKAFTDNSINLKFHVESPQQYWDKIREQLKSKAAKENKIYDESIMKVYEERILAKITNILSGAENVGKMWHTTKIIDTNGNDIKEYGWTIKPIDQNVKDFIEAQISVSKRADYAVGAALGIHSALGNISESGKSDSGSEQLYAHQTHLSSNVSVPEMITTKAINMALRINFPELDYKIGFHRQGVKRQQEISPKDRPINQ